MIRRNLPLIFVTFLALIAVSGCVTVSGSRSADGRPPADADGRPPGAGPGSPYRPGERGGGRDAALPLTQLPVSRPAALAPTAVLPAARPQPDRDADRNSGRRTAERQGGHHRPRPSRVWTSRTAESAPKPKAHAKAKAHPKGKAKAKKRARSAGTPVVARRPRQAPTAGRADMAELCRSSKGITNPSITQLCQGTFGR
ncbi:hypothetical protein [Streptomyces sp. NPDC051211]|uniref:hypothetical protein n=1 Tax=Streptomyces sp. NPDC051211 TaxID=3154643 RepID=UPI00344C13B8